MSAYEALALSQAKSPFMAVSEVRPGMKGYGLTVFRGETPERFGIEVIDVLHQFRPDQDLILVRVDHPILDRATTIAGMSGSPVYIDDRMIGAYAYGWTFGKEPIAGVTPIANMLAEIKRPIDPSMFRALGTQPLPLGATSAPTSGARVPHAGLSVPTSPSNGRVGAFDALRMHAEHHGPAAAAGPEELRWGRPLPAAAALQLSGLGPASTELLTRELGPYGFQPVQAGASAAGPAFDPKAKVSRFVDGGSIGVQLVRGDISVMAVGTVTHVAGERLVAFGHPMLNAGQIALATCRARVVHIMSSVMRSFKIAEPSAPLGVLVHDRQAAIVVDQQLQADMLPLRVKLHGVPGAPRTEWTMQVASHRLLTSGLVLSALTNALEASASDRTDAVLRFESRVGIAGHGEQHTTDLVFTPGGAADGQVVSRLRLFGVLGAAYGNPFEDARVTSIDVDLHVQYAHDVVTIVDAQLPSDTVDPGATVQLAITLRQYDAQEQTQLVPLHIPTSAAGETLEIAVAPGDEIEVDRPKPNSLDDLLRAIRTSYSGTSLVVSTKLPSAGVKLRGQLVRSLPGSALDTLQPANAADRGSLFPTYERQELPLGHAVIGSAKLKLNVRAEPLR
ncbi:MAG: SpoIVB peptidase S55 domain-containing protein [Polyangiales bacterium]